MIQLLKCIVIYTIFIGIKLIYLYWKFSDRFIELLKDCFHSLNLLLPFGFRFLAILIYESAILFEVWFQCICQSNFIHLLNQFSLYLIIPFQRLSIYIIIAYFEGILPKGPYRPCVSPFGRIPSILSFILQRWLFYINSTLFCVHLKTFSSIHKITAFWLQWFR